MNCFYFTVIVNFHKHIYGYIETCIRNPNLKQVYHYQGYCHYCDKVLKYSFMEHYFCHMFFYVGDLLNTFSRDKTCLILHEENIYKIASL